MRLVNTSTGGSPVDAELRWSRVDLSARLRARGVPVPGGTGRPILGTLARVYYDLHPQMQPRMTVALWDLDGHTYEFRARAADLAEFTMLIDSLSRVEESEWLAALPPGVVKPVDHATTVASMLRGVTVPPEFDPTTVRSAGLVKDRYQFGALVAGSVACTWFRRWSEARSSGDAATVREAIEAMATAKDWPILQEMAESGAYPWVIERFSEAMPSGIWHGRPLEGDVDSGLGCPALGIPLKAPKAA